MNVSAVLQAILDSAKAFLGGIGEGTVDFFESITTVTNGSTTSMSSLMEFILAIVGITIALAVIRAIWRLIGGYRRLA